MCCDILQDPREESETKTLELHLCVHQELGPAEGNAESGGASRPAAAA